MQPAPSLALTTFARSLRPRAQLFARMQIGDKGLAKLAEEAAWQQFTRQAADIPLAQWPLSFWSCLLKNQYLADDENSRLLPTALQPLSADRRQAWLLKHIANLNTTNAAQCLQVSETRYLESLIDSERRLHDAGYDAEKMQRLRKQWLDSLQQPSSATESINTADENVTADKTAGDDSAPTSSTVAETKSAKTAPSRGRQMLLWLSACACIGLLSWAGLSVWKDLNPPAPVKPPPPPIPASEAAITVMHPDYALLKVIDDEPLISRIDRLSWWLVKITPELEQSSSVPAAQLAAAPANFQALPATSQTLLASIGSTWEVLSDDQRRNLQANAAHWLSMNAEQQNQFIAIRKRWDNRAINERNSAKQRFALWQSLPQAEQQALRAADYQWQQLPVSESSALENEFTSLTPEQQEAWWLGPSLGAQFEGLRPLFEFAPLADRPILLNYLRSQTADQRIALAEQIKNSSAAQREKLRKDLLQAATTPAATPTSKN
jgi:hypothetical protein